MVNVSEKKGVKLFVEGGRDSNSQIRKAFQRFFERGGVARRPRVIASGARNNAWADFCEETLHGTHHALLLVDSEGPVANGEKPLAHLRARDRWKIPLDVRDGQVFLMVQAMEAWLVADPAALEAFFGNGFKRSALSGRRPESMSPDDLMACLNKATGDCNGRYRKGKRSFEVLENVDPTIVEKACPSAGRFLRELRDIMR